MHLVTLASFLFTDKKENLFTVTTPKNSHNDWQYTSAATKKKDDAIKRSVTDGVSRRVVDSLILVDHEVTISEAYYRNVMLLQ